MFRMPFVIFIAIAALASASSAQENEKTLTPVAQDKKERKDEPPKDKVAKKILVTGSYIRQAVSQKAPTPLSTYDQSRMLETGSYTVADALQESAAFTNVSTGAYVSLHGQTNADNLILLNGLRLPKTAGGGGVNIDFLPASAIERTEILKDGASALYGSEALSGVINIITKRDMDGANIFVRNTTPQEMVDQETTVGATYGKNWGKNHFLGILQFKGDKPVQYNQTEYGIKDVTLAGRLYGPYANLTNGATLARDPACPAGNLDSRGRCRFNHLELDPIGGTGEKRKYYSSYLTYGHDFSDQLKVDLTGMYMRRDWYFGMSPISIDFRDDTGIGGQNYAIPDSIANTWGAVNAANGAPVTFSGPVSMTYSALEEIGQREFERNVDNYIAQARSYGEVNGWDWEVSSGYGRTFFKDAMIRGNASKQGMYDLLLSGAFRPLDPAGSKSDLSSVALQTWQEHNSDTWNNKALIAGPLFDLGHSPLSMAVGVETQNQSFSYRNDPFSLAGIPISGRATNQDGKRQVYSTFLELTHSPSKKFDIQLAGRFDEYSDVGSTVNPKIGLAYHHSEQITYRGSYGTGFKAPDLLSVFQGQATSIQGSIRDPQVCDDDATDVHCVNTVAEVTTFGNKNLKPETASHYNIGTVITPQKKLAFTVDYWVVDGEQGLSEINPNIILRAQSLGVDLSSYGIVVERDADGFVTNITHPVRVNAGIFKIRGVDFGIQKLTQFHTHLLGTVSVRLTMEHSHVISSGGQSFGFDPITKWYDLNWKNFSAVSFQKDQNFLKLIARSFAAQDKNRVLNTGIGKGSTPTFTEFDVHYERFLGNDSSVSFGIKNIFDIKPFNDTSTPGAVFPPPGTQNTFLGRTFYAGYSQDF